MCRSRVESKRGSYAGRIAPPGMPNTTRAPTSSSARTSAWAPVSCSGSVIVTASFRVSALLVVRHQKTPRAEGTEGSRAGRKLSAGARFDYYEKLGHEGTVPDRHGEVKFTHRQATQ